MRPNLETVQGMAFCMETSPLKVVKTDEHNFRISHNSSAKHAEMRYEEKVEQRKDAKKTSVVPRTSSNDGSKTVISQITCILDK